MKLTSSATLLAAALLGGCGPDKAAGPFQLGPVTHVRVYELDTGAQDVSVARGKTVHLAMLEYDIHDSVPSVRGQWMTRNATVASNSGVSTRCQ
jgi:hypothetical protein